MTEKLVVTRLWGARTFQFDGSEESYYELCKFAPAFDIYVESWEGGMAKLSVRHGNHVEEMGPGDYLIRPTGPVYGFLVLAAEAFRRLFTEKHNYSLTDLEVISSDHPIEKIMDESTKFPQKFYISVQHVYSVAWMPGNLTKAYKFQAPIRPAWGPERYEELVRDRIGAKERDAVILSFSQWPAPILKGVPELIQPMSKVV